MCAQQTLPPTSQPCFGAVNVLNYTRISPLMGPRQTPPQVSSTSHLPLALPRNPPSVASAANLYLILQLLLTNLQQAPLLPSRCSDRGNCLRFLAQSLNLPMTARTFAAPFCHSSARNGRSCCDDPVRLGRRVLDRGKKQNIIISSGQI
jgi:hypothetical protein